MLRFRRDAGTDRRFDRFAVYFLGRSDLLADADTARLAKYSYSQARQIVGESPREFLRVIDGVRHGGPKPKIDGAAADELVRLVGAEQITGPCALAQQLKNGGVQVSSQTVTRAMDRLHLRAAARAIRERAKDRPLLTRFAGVWLLIPLLLGLYPIIERVFTGRRAVRCMLTLFACAFVGIARVFHLPDIQDPGLALFTGGRKILSRHTVGSFQKDVLPSKVRAFLKLTEPLARYARQVLRVSFDDHVIPRWTRLFGISKGYSSIRNRKMHAERIYTFFEVPSRRVLQMIAGAGKHLMHQIVLDTLEKFVRTFRPRDARLYFDAGASQDDAITAKLLKRRETILVRAPRRPWWMKKWQNLPADEFRTYWEPTQKKGHKRRLRVAQTRTLLPGLPRGARTLVAVEDRPPKGGKRKDRWHILFTNDEKTDAYTLILEFRQRQHHEMSFRVGVHDFHLDALPNGYRWWSPDRDHPGFEPQRPALVGWVKALAFNGIQDWKDRLPAPYSKMMPFTLMRKFLFRPGLVRLTPSAVTVTIGTFKEARALESWIAELNARQIKIPWLGNRTLRIELGKLLVSCER